MTIPPPPPILNYMPAGPDRVYLRHVARQQRNIMLCILAYFAGCLMGITSRLAPPGPIQPIMGLIAFVAVISAMIFALICVIRLITRMYGTVVGVILGILILIPLIGLIVLLVVNGKATAILKQHGLGVGLLGADPKAIDRM